MGTMQPNKGPFGSVAPPQRSGPAVTTGRPSAGFQTMPPRAEPTPGHGVQRYGHGYGNPFSAMRRFMDQMDRMFEDFGGTPSIFTPQDRFLFQGGEHGVWSPAIEVAHEGEEFVVRADLPGLDRDSVHVEIQGDLLTLSGERRQQHDDQRGEWFHSERSYGTFRRSVRLPRGADAANAEATFADGVLEVRMAASKPTGRKLQVRAKASSPGKPGAKGSPEES